MKNKWKLYFIRIATMLFFMSLIFFPTSQSQAKEKTGILRVEYLAYTGEESIALQNTEFSLYEVGTIENGKRILHTKFLPSGVDLNVKDLSELKSMSERLIQFLVEKKVLGETQVTDKNGIAEFTINEQKTYLLAQTKPITYDEKIQYMTTPTLLDIHDLENTTVLTINPKSEWQEIDPQIKPDDPEKVQTGDNNKESVWIILCVTSLIIMYGVKKFRIIIK